MLLVGACDIKMWPSKRIRDKQNKTVQKWQKYLAEFSILFEWKQRKKSIKQRKSKASQQQSGQYTHPRKVAIGINFISICFYSVRLFVRLLIFFEHFTTFKFGKWHAKRERDGDANENKGNTNAFFFQRTFKMQTLISMLAFY